MQNLSETLKSLAIDGKLSLEKVLSIVKPIDQEREETKDLLRLCEKQVGLTLGEDINRHISKMQGTVFNDVAYHYEDMPDNQKI